jgi:hypothetical protein
VVLRDRRKRDREAPDLVAAISVGNLAKKSRQRQLPSVDPGMLLRIGNVETANGK